MHNVATPNESYQATKPLLPIGVNAGVATQLQVYADNSATASYGLNDGVVVFCLGIASLSDAMGAPLDGTEAVWL